MGKRECENHAGRGHSFTWFNYGEDRWRTDPPGDTKCNCCEKLWEAVGQANIAAEVCPGAWSQHRDRLAFTRALQSAGGQL